MRIHRLAGLTLAALLAVSVVVALSSLSGCTRPSPSERMPVAATALSSAAMISATLCSGGPASFDCQWSPRATDLDIKRKRLLKRTEAGEIAHDQAEAIQAALNNSHDLLETALKACGVDSHTGNCTDDAVTAEEALARAALVLGGIQIPDAALPQ
jgi:hypothetical protein